MTNSDSTSTDVQPAGSRRRRTRPFLKGILATVVAFLGVGFFAAPAFAHVNTVTGVASCPSGATQTIVWTIANSATTAAETAGSFTTSVIGATFSASSVNIGAPPATGTVTETIPATYTGGTVTLSIVGVWTDNVTAPASGTAALATGCSAPDIGIVKTVSPNTVAAGSTTPVVYTVAVTNSGSQPTTTTTIVTDPIPAGLTYLAGSASCGTTPTCSASEGSGVVTYSIPAPIYGGVTDDLTFAVTANANDPTGTITNTAGLTSPGCVAGVPAATCASSVPITVTNNAALLLVKTASTGNVTAGQTSPVTYTLTVSNPAPANSTTASSATVSDAVPSGLTYVAGSVSCGTLTTTGTPSTPSCTAGYNAAANSVSYTLGAGIVAGASYPVTFQATVNAADTASIVNTATLTGPGCNAGVPAATCSSSVTITVAHFTVSKSDSAGSGLVNPGQVVTYTLTAKNIGSGPGAITVMDAAPTGTTLTTPAPACPAGTTATCSVTVTGSSISWVINGLAPGATDDLTFAVVVNPGTGGTHILNTGLYTEPGCTTAGGCSTNTTDNPVPPPTSPGTPTTTTTTTPVTAVQTGATPTAISGATTVHTGEPWAGSTPYVLAALAFGISLLSLGAFLRRRRIAGVPTA